MLVRLALVSLVALVALVACESPGGGPVTQGPLAQCQNGALDPNETGIDCGGSSACARCTIGQACGDGGDCASSACVGGVCVEGTAAPRCDDQVQNGGESAVDCGGPCTGCGAGRACGGNGDCLGGVCEAGVCAAAATCSDGARSPGETDLDCGGPCPPCATDKNCGGNGDCLSDICINGVCRDPSCTDQRKNQDETGVDCGGALCGPCVDLAACALPRDCLSGRCEGGACASCDDGRKTGEETGVDCGGVCEGKCADGEGCVGNSDCDSYRCETGVCRSCADRLNTGPETDIDCGGPCGTCGDGKLCQRDEDCDSRRCDDGKCASCTDRRKTGDETDVDCGGPACGPCADGLLCQDNGDCRVDSRCEGGRCISCTDGKQNGDETGVDCGGRCDRCELGGACEEAIDCTNGFCFGGVCCTKNRCADNCDPTPTEICNGADDDCDGQTDEGALVAPTPCGLSVGVCAGTTPTCAGGWVCDYEAHDARYEAIETRCDGLDNDCDGLTDEGVSNGCGACGGGSNEICDGVDNDCDGETDELAACAECRATPTIITFSPRAGTAFGAPVSAGAIVAGATDQVWSVHTEVNGDKNQLYVTRYTGGATATATSVNDHALQPTMVLDGTLLGIAARADFNDNRRFHRVTTGGTPSSAGVSILSTTTPVTTLIQRAFLVNGDAWYTQYADGVASAWHQPSGGDWALYDTATRTNVLGFVWIDGTPYAVRNAPNQLVLMDIYSADTTKVIAGEMAQSVILSQRNNGDIALLDHSNSSFNHIYRRDRTTGTWVELTVPFPGAFEVVAVDALPNGPIVMVGTASGAPRRLTASVLQPGADRWTTVTYQGVTNIDSIRATAVIDDAGRAHFFGQTTDGTKRIYAMMCPACPNGVCVGAASGSVIINEVLYDAVGADNDTFVELLGPPGTSLDGYVLQGGAGDTGEVYRTVNLSGTIPADGIFLIANTNAGANLKALADLVANVDFQNGPDAIVLVSPQGLTLDALAYQTTTEISYFDGEGSDAGPVTAGQSLARTNGVDTNNNATDFKPKTPSPGAPN